MKADTAHEHWDAAWAGIRADSKWLKPEPDVLLWADGFEPGTRVLDLGAGVGRHALALAQAGFDVTAFDAAPQGLEALRRAAAENGLDVGIELGKMDALPHDDMSFDHVLSWNVIYHGNETVLLNTIAEIRRVIKPGGTILLTMLSKRRLWIDRQKLKDPREVSRNTWVFDEDGSDKRYPHYYCDAREMLTLFQGFEVLWLEDREHDSPGSWHWHSILERQA